MWSKNLSHGEVNPEAKRQGQGVERIGDPYGDGQYKIIWIRTENDLMVGLFYVTPNDAGGNPIVKAGDRVKAGQARRQHAGSDEEIPRYG